MLPLFVSAIGLVVDVGRDGFPPGDRALIELRTRDVGHHRALTGLGSREDWSHPGPALFYLLALPYRLGGSASIGINLGALLINGAAIVGMALLARRRGGTPLLLLTLLGCALLVRSLGPDFLRDPWNPYVPVLPFALLLFLCWAMACGDAWALPAATAVASFCVQTHIGYAPLAIPVLAWGAGWLVWRGRRGPERRRVPASARAAFTAAAVVVVLWAPPIVDQLGVSHNMTKIADYFRTSDDRPNTLGDGYRAVAAELGWSPEWLTGPPARNPFNGEPGYLDSARLPLLLVPFAAAAVLLWRRRAAAAPLILTLILTMALGVFAVARILGPVYEYRLRWTWVVAMMVALVVAWAIEVVSPRRWLEAVAIAALLALAGANSVSAARAGVVHELESSALRKVTPAVVRGLPPGAGDVIVRPTSFGSSIYAAGLVLQLERRGVVARVDPEGEVGFGAWRVHRRGPVRAVLTVAADNNVEDVSARPDLRLVASWRTQSAARRADAIGRLAQLRREYEAGRLPITEYFERAARAHLGRALAVFTARATPPR